ncbi:hypothetical protein [Salipiger mucosus]|uniref:Uncharacterized protein n=1 Tax=Salipiger mucosus DSM 16094 TaxID=1123237 RepID=S9QKU5_9RHOB|nr:hypothetical protein [Salipiger mucosus]EPX82056.1 hypothetical protein Salmuc_02422 [Salipiger mucosus DSM 16094]
MRPTPLLLAAALLAACTQFPELDATQTPGVATAPYPDLVPLDWLTDAPEPRATPEMRAGIEGRVAGLRGRAARLQASEVIPSSVRARMEAGVRWPY